jgi:hypothetical protein
MPYQLIIHYDDATTEIAAAGTLEEVQKVMPIIATTLDPDTALWEVKFVPAAYEHNLLLHGTAQLGIAVNRQR